MGDERPKLNCPECGVGLIPATGRGRFDSEGEEARHRDTCRCRWCEWWWEETYERFACECGCVARVHCDDGHAYAVEVSRG